MRCECGCRASVPASAPRGGPRRRFATSACRDRAYRQRVREEEFEQLASDPPGRPTLEQVRARLRRASREILILSEAS